jgi:hypothetical protein
MQCLESIPPLEMDDFLRYPAQFYNWAHALRPARPIECPLRNLGRTAVLATGFAEQENIRQFAYQYWDELEDYEPESLAGPVHKLLQLADAAIAGRFRLPSLRTAVIAFTGLKHGCLQQSERDRLWRAFQIPAFEQFRGFTQELLAWECEAHDGLHVHEDNAIFETASREKELLLTCLACDEYSLVRLGTRMTARIATSPCGCGEPAPRLMGLRELPVRRLAMASAAAAGD